MNINNELERRRERLEEYPEGPELIDEEEDEDLWPDERDYHEAWNETDLEPFDFDDDEF